MQRSIILKNQVVYFLILFQLYQINAMAQKGNCIQGDCKNGKAVLISDDNTRYEGDFKNGSFVKGKCTYSDSSSFEGSFIKFKPNGYCIFLNPGKKMRFTGNVSLGALNGAGRLVQKISNNDSLIIKGIWTKNSLNGKTSISYKKGGATAYTINCITSDGNPAPGPITIQFADSRLYSGKIEPGNRVTGSMSKKGIVSALGKGKVFGSIDEVVAFYEENAAGGNAKSTSKKKNASRTYADGSVYTGEWKDSLQHGAGTYTWPNGDKYIGHWAKGLREGNGIKYDGKGEILQEGIWRNGILAESSRETFYGDDEVIEFDEGRYSGQATNRTPNGIGSIESKNGHYYKGEWKNGTKDGWGLYKFPNGTVYEGQFRGLPNGLGLIIYANGDFYEGEFKDGKPHGKGFKFTAAVGRYDGEWNMMVKEGFGSFVWNNGERFTGSFKNDEIDGQGTKYDKDGRVLKTGNWVNGKLESQ